MGYFYKGRLCISLAAAVLLADLNRPGKPGRKRPRRPRAFLPQGPRLFPFHRFNPATTPMKQGSFTAHMPCFVLSYTDAAGFTSSRPDDALADWLNAELDRAPGQTFMPPALLAQKVLAQILPEARVENLVVVPLPELDGDPEQVLP